MFTVRGLEWLHREMHGCLDVVLDHLRTTPAETINVIVSGFGLPTVGAQLVHVLGVEQAWVHGLQHLPIERWTVRDYPTLESIAAAKARVRNDTARYLSGLTDATVNAELEALPDGWIGPRRSPAFILLHVMTHAFHHKGQMASMLRRLGYPVPDTDLQRA